MVITEVACGINCTYSTALFNKYGLDCTAAEHTLGIHFQGTKVRKLSLLPAFSSQRKKQCKSKVSELTPPSGMFIAIVYLPSPLPFVSEMKGNPRKLSKPLVIIIMETKQRIWCWKGSMEIIFKVLSFGVVHFLFQPITHFLLPFS